MRRYLPIWVALLCAALCGAAYFARGRLVSLPYRDHFATEGLKNWQSLGGDWFTEAGTVTNESEERGAKLLFGSDRWTDYSLSADVEVLGPDGDAGLILRSTDEQLGMNAYSGYYAGLRTHDGRLVLGRADYGWLESQTITSPTAIQMQHWYHLDVVAVGCTVAAVATDVASGIQSKASMQGEPCVHHGRIGLRSYATGGRWRNLVVTPAGPDTLAALHAARQPREATDVAQVGFHPNRVAELSRRLNPASPHTTSPLRSIGSLRYAGSLNPRPVTVHGTVILRRPTLFVQDASGGIAIPDQDPLRFAPGDEVEAAGTPALGDFSLQLEHAAVEVLGPGKPLPPKSVTASEAATGIYDAQYIEVTGLVSEAWSSRKTPELIIDSGSQSFRALLPDMANSARPLHLKKDALVRVRGVEAVDPSLTGNRTPFVLFLSSPDAIELLADPPWWNLQNLIWIAPIVVSLLLLAQLGRVHIRHQRIQAALEERQRLGREVHDTLAQSFAGLGYQLQAVRSSVAAGSPAASEHIDLAIDMVRHSHQEARRSIASMQLELLEGAELAATLEERARHMVKGTPLRIRAGTSGEPRQLQPRVIDALFRVGQEAVANAIRHASPSTLTILVTFERHAVELIVEDDGVGYDPGANLPGFGILSMRKRAEAVGAHLLIVSQPGRGARVSLRVSAHRTPALGVARRRNGGPATL